MKRGVFMRKYRKILFNAPGIKKYKYVRRVIIMLIQFSFKNFKSFKDETLVDLTASSVKEHPYNLIETVNGDKYLKVLAIYGANASGKSNVIEAFSFMRSFVMNSLSLVSDEDKHHKKAIPIKSFLFEDSNKKHPSEFEVFFHHKNTEYQYGFIVDRDKILAEWLYSKTPKSKSFDTLFERTENKFKFGKKMSNAVKFEDSVEDKTLFLSLTAKTKISISRNVYNWFLEHFVIDFGDIDFERYFSRAIPAQMLENDDYKKRLEDFLIAIDTGIVSLRFEKNGLINEEQEESYLVYSKHLVNEKGDTKEILFSEESSGTRKMFCLFDFFYDALQNGYTLFIDELNAKLHPILVRYIINVFHDPETNKNNAQLIFTTHDLFNLTRDVFRRDEIWFTEKDRLGVSKLFSLVEYKLEDNTKVRSDATYYKDYVSGRYGAIPLLKEFNLLEGS